MPAISGDAPPVVFALPASAAARGAGERTPRHSEPARTRLVLAWARLLRHPELSQAHLVPARARRGSKALRGALRRGTPAVCRRRGRCAEHCAPASPDGAHGVGGLGEVRGGASSEVGTSRESADRFVVHAQAAVLTCHCCCCYALSGGSPALCALRACRAHPAGLSRGPPVSGVSPLTAWHAAIPMLSRLRLLHFFSPSSLRDSMRCRQCRPLTPPSRP